MAWALDQANIFEGNDGGAGDNPANFTTVNAVASGAHAFVYVFSDILPTGVTIGGNAMQLDRSQQNSDWGSLWSKYLVSGVASSSTIAVTFSGAPNFCAACASSFLGGATTSWKDQANSRAMSSDLTGWTTGSVTPTAANSLVIGVHKSSGTDSRSTPDANFPETHDFRGFDNIVMVYRITTDSSAQNPTGTYVSSQSPSPTQIGITVNYLVAGGGGTNATVTAVVASSTASAVAPPKPRPTAPFAEINVRM